MHYIILCDTPVVVVTLFQLKYTESNSLISCSCTLSDCTAIMGCLALDALHGSACCAYITVLMSQGLAISKAGGKKKL